MKILSIVVFLVLISQGYSECSLSDLHISQDLTGIVQGKKEWIVSIVSDCPCAQSVTLDCNGFQSVEPIPSFLKVLSPQGICLLNGGQRFTSTRLFIFRYAWDHEFALNPIHIESCS